MLSQSACSAGGGLTIDLTNRHKKTSLRDFWKAFDVSDEKGYF